MGQLRRGSADATRAASSGEPIVRFIPRGHQSVAARVLAVTRRPDHTGHTTHLFLTILTAGVGGVIVWLPLTLRHKRRHARRTA